MAKKKRRQLLTFGGGRMRAINPILIPPNSLRSLKDWALSREFEGSLTLADPPTSYWTPTDGTAISSLATGVDASGVVFLYAVAGTILKQYNPATATAANVKTGLTSAKAASVAVMNNSSGTVTAYICNGNDAPFKTAVSASPSASNIGLTRPTVTNASTALNGAGNVKGTVKYFLAQMSTTTEGALSSSFGEIDAKDGNIVDVDLTHADFGANTYRLYRTTANRESPRYVATVTGGTTYSDDTLDSALGDVPFLHGDPPPTTSTLFFPYLNRLWAVDKNKVYFSDVGNPESFFLGGNYLIAGESDGDTVISWAEDESGLILFSQNRSQRLLGRRVEEFELVNISGKDTSSSTTSLGPQSKDCVAVTPAGAYFSRGERLYRVVGNSIEFVESLAEEGKGSTVFPLYFEPLTGILYASGSTTYLQDFASKIWVAELSRRASSFSGAKGGYILGVGQDSDNDNVYLFPVKFYMASIDSKSTNVFTQNLETSRFFGEDPTSLKRFLWVDILSSISTLKGPVNGLRQLQVVISTDGVDGSAISLKEGETRVPINLEGYYVSVKLTVPGIQYIPPNSLWKPILIHGIKLVWEELPDLIQHPFTQT